ncbi:MAG: ABC transporter permease [Bauldia sp.]|nr:MAG: ABC transporter permease [Bauldia sp.]MBZ0228763.1 ABC transporter permease [Bauldia sp.]
MQPDAAAETGSARPNIGDIRIQDVVTIKEQTTFERIISSQAFWVTVALAMIILLMSYLQPQAFASQENFYNITRNFAYIGIMSVGMVCVIVTGGIDLSVGSTMGLVGVVCGITLQAGLHWAVAIVAGLGAGICVGAINGALIAYAGLSPFVVTLGMLSFARSFAIVLSGNKMIYEFGPYKPGFRALGGGEFLGMSNMVWALIILAVVIGLILKYTTWGRHIYSIGGNEQAARLTGVPVNRVKMQAYMVAGATAAVAGIMVVGWQGSAINALGTGYELKVIASTVIGGANLMGGEGGTYGAFVGAALLEVIRNSLLMQGIDSNWQGAFVGVFIVLAVLLEKIRGRRRA